MSTESVSDCSSPQKVDFDSQLGSSENVWEQKRMMSSAGLLVMSWSLEVFSSWMRTNQSWTLTKILNALIVNTEQIGGATLTDISRPCTTWCDTSAHSVTSASQTDALCPGTHKCDDCPFASTRLSNLRAHIRASPLQIKLQCSECDYKSDTSQTLKRQYVSMTAVGAFL